MTFKLKQRDTAPAILKQCVIDISGVATPVSLVGATVVFNMRTELGVVICNRKAATVFVGTVPGIGAVTAVDGWVRYQWVVGDTSTAGIFQAEFEVTFADASIETFPNVGYETVLITGDLG